MNWISVKDRLPEIDPKNPQPIPVLVYEYGFIEIGQFGAVNKHFHTFDKEFHVDGETATGVTHWMPLPEPPKERETK